MQNIPADLFAILQASGMTIPGECYANACKAVLQGHFETYVLGLAELPGENIPVRHAWVETAGVSFDPTLQQSGFNLQTEYEARCRLSSTDIYRLIQQHYGRAELKRRNDLELGFNIPILDRAYNVVIEDN